VEPISESKIAAILYFTFTGPLIVFLSAPVFLPLVVGIPKWRSLDNPWGFVTVGILVLYVFAAVFAYLAFFLGIRNGIAFQVAPPGTPPATILTRFWWPVRVYGSLSIFLFMAIAFLRDVRAGWSH
jgi:drug/metabolite transporter (DMT)-like permease